jgi:tetratricopeptide (TPR) repeat protein
VIQVPLGQAIDHCWWCQQSRARPRETSYNREVKPAARAWSLPTSRRTLGAVCLLVALSLGGCKWLGLTYWLGKYDRDIAEATRAIAGAKDSSDRAAHLGERGRAYSEKVRYSRFAKCISLAEYNQIFSLAVEDHNLAINLAPNQSKPYVQRGWTYYDRATVIMGDTLETKDAYPTWLKRAHDDFTSAIERDARDILALDMRALTRSALGDRDGVIADLTASFAMDGASRSRLADAYCDRGGFRQGQMDSAGAISDYEQSITLGGASDGCSCDPYAPLAYIYCDGTHQYEKSWDTINRARRANRWIPPELVEKLSKLSHR